MRCARVHGSTARAAPAGADWLQRRGCARDIPDSERRQMSPRALASSGMLRRAGPPQTGGCSARTAEHEPVSSPSISLVSRPFCLNHDKHWPAAPEIKWTTVGGHQQTKASPSPRPACHGRSAAPDAPADPAKHGWPDRRRFGGGLTASSEMKRDVQDPTQVQTLPSIKIAHGDSD